MEKEFNMVMGDVHGDWDGIIATLDHFEIRNCNIFQLGDFGIGLKLKEHEDLSLTDLNDCLKEFNIHLYVIRGNHDDPKYFDGNYTKWSHITFVKDYSIFTLCDMNILCVGGAISIDRKEADFINSMGEKTKWKGRIEGFDYWKDEIFVLKSDILKEMSGIDVVLTHSAPSSFFPLGTGVLNPKDPELYYDVIKERSDLDTMYQILRENNDIKYWCYGHFHKGNIEYIHNTKIVLMNILAAYRLA